MTLNPPSGSSQQQTQRRIPVSSFICSAHFHWHLINVQQGLGTQREQHGPRQSSPSDLPFILGWATSLKAPLQLVACCIVLGVVQESWPPKGNRDPSSFL